MSYLFNDDLTSNVEIEKSSRSQKTGTKELSASKIFDLVKVVVLYSKERLKEYTSSGGKIMGTKEETLKWQYQNGGIV